MLETKVNDFTKITEIPIMPDRFNTTSRPVDYPIIHPSLASISKPKNYN